jgi:hypothetical protein
MRNKLKSSTSHLLSSGVSEQGAVYGADLAGRSGPTRSTALQAAGKTPGWQPTTAPVSTLPMEPILVRLNDALQLSGFSRSYLYRRASRKEIIFFKCGSRVLVDFASLKAAIENLPRVQINITV